MVAVAAAVVALGLTRGNGDSSAREARAPRTATLPDTAVQRRPLCAGAAARSPFGVRCDTRGLSRRVAPSPEVAARHYRTGCKDTTPAGALEVCSFGVPAAQARRTIAVIGDSHAGHWLPAFDRLARQRRWRGISIVHTACPLSTAVRALPNPTRFVGCVQWKRQVFAWLQIHRDIDTTFVGGLSGGTGVVPKPGRTEFATSVAGYRQAWRALLHSSREIVVLHDTPKSSGHVVECVQRLLADGGEPGPACALPRSRALDPDPLMAAARLEHSPRIRTIDLTSVFCDAERCEPVIGGMLVTRDESHLTQTFSATLAPLLAVAIDRLKLA